MNLPGAGNKALRWLNKFSRLFSRIATTSASIVNYYSQDGWLRAEPFYDLCWTYARDEHWLEGTDWDCAPSSRDNFLLRSPCENLRAR